MGKKAKNSASKDDKKRSEVKMGGSKVKTKSKPGKSKSKSKNGKKRAKKRHSAEAYMPEEERVVLVEQFLAEAVKDPEKIASMPVVLVCAPDIPENNFADDDEVEIEGDEEMGMDFLNSFMASPIERSTLFWAQPIADHLPQEATSRDIIQLVGFIKELRRRTGRNIVLTIEYTPEKSFVSDRPIITTNCVRNQEFLNTLTTPIGMFGFIELMIDPVSGGTYGRYYVPISVATLNEMGAKTCSTALSGPLQLTVPWIAESKISFPPQRVSHYVPGTKAMDDAMKFWSMFYRGEIMGPDCPEAEMLQSMLTSDDTPSVRLYKGSSGFQILDPDLFSGGKVQVLDDIELSDIELATQVPEKVLFGKEAIEWAQEQLDAALENYYNVWHVHEYVIEFSRALLVVKKQIRDVKVRITKKASLK